MLAQVASAWQLSVPLSHSLISYYLVHIKNSRKKETDSKKEQNQSIRIRFHHTLIYMCIHNFQLYWHNQHHHDIPHYLLNIHWYLCIFHFRFLFILFFYFLNKKHEANHTITINSIISRWTITKIISIQSGWTNLCCSTSPYWATKNYKEKEKLRTKKKKKKKKRKKERHRKL